MKVHLHTPSPPPRGAAGAWNSGIHQPAWPSAALAIPSIHNQDQQGVVQGEELPQGQGQEMTFCHAHQEAGPELSQAPRWIWEPA